MLNRPFIEATFERGLHLQSKVQNDGRSDVGSENVATNDTNRCPSESTERNVGMWGEEVQQDVPVAKPQL